MTLTLRGWLITAGAAIFSSLATDAIRAQSFHDAITEVARTKVQQPANLRARARPSVTGANSGSPAEKLPEFEQRAKPTGAVTKEDGYRYQPTVDETAKDWPNAEVQIAQARCRFLLQRINAEIVALDPIKDGGCGDPAPVKLISVGTKPKVAFDPPALVNCDMVQSLHDWIIRDLQPLARRHLKSPITAVETMSSYSCRNAYGRKDTRLSEHARANAMDIRGFRTAKSDKTHLMTHWGPTQRDLNASRLAAAQRKANMAEVARAAATQQAVTRRAAAAPAAASPPGATPEMAEAAPEANAVALSNSFRPTFLDSLGAGAKTALGIAPSQLGGPAVTALQSEARAEAPSWPVLLVADTIDTSKASTPSARFLREAHTTACRIFGTVLGPEANTAHRNHFHVDRAQRDLGNYCR